MVYLKCVRFLMFYPTSLGIVAGEIKTTQRHTISLKTSICGRNRELTDNSFSFHTGAFLSVSENETCSRAIYITSSIVTPVRLEPTIVLAFSEYNDVLPLTGQVDTDIGCVV